MLSRFVTAARVVYSMCFCSGEREEESLFLSNARMCDENHFHFAFPSAKNEKFGREKDTNADVVLNRFSDENDGFC